MRRPAVTVLMGCEGAGKTIWKRANAERLPVSLFDPVGLAGGLGDPTSAGAHRRAWAIIDAEVAALVEAREGFGIVEDDPAGRVPALVAGLRAAGYRTEAIYLGTESPSINVARIEHRVRGRTGRPVDLAQVPAQWRESLSHLAQSAERFDRLQLLDNSGDGPAVQCRLERGRVVERLDVGDMAAWCAAWLAGIEQQ